MPDELLHAARLDGCSEFRIYWEIVMPISRPMIGAFCLISFMGSWNNFLSICQQYFIMSRHGAKVDLFGNILSSLGLRKAKASS